MPSALPIGPAMKPAHVLFGLTFGANFLWPNAIPPSMEKLSPMNATTNGISTNAGPMFRSSAMQPYIAGNKKRRHDADRHVRERNGMFCAVRADGEEKQTP